MKFPWANIAILVLGAVELLTGYLALTHGTPEWVAALQVHRILGFSIVALLFWKGRNILSRLTVSRLWKRDWMPYSASLLMLGLLLSALTLGLVWSHAGPFYYLGLSGVSWAHLPVASPNSHPPVAHFEASLELSHPILGRPENGLTDGWLRPGRVGAVAGRRVGKPIGKLAWSQPPLYGFLRKRECERKRIPINVLVERCARSGGPIKLVPECNRPG